MNLKIKNKIIIGLVVAFVFSLSQSSGAQVVSAVSISSGEIIALTNSSRVEAGLPELSVSDKLSVAAEKKARDMFANQYFDHNSPQGLTPWDFIKSAGYEYRYAGENLAIDFISANSVHRALMESSSHRANILNENYSQIGVAVVEDIFEGSKSIIVVEEFGMPLQKEEIFDVSMQELDIEIEQKMNEINVKAVKVDTQKVKSGESIESEIEEDLDELSNNLDCVENEEKLVLIEDNFNGVCEAENEIFFAGVFMKENKINPAIYTESNYISSRIKAENKLVEKENINIVNNAQIRNENFGKQKLVAVINSVIIKNDLIIKLTFFYAIIFFMIMGSAIPLFIAYKIFV